VWLLLIRSLREGLRNPIIVYGMPVIIPLSILLLVSTTLSRVTELPGFPTANYADWMTPAVVMLSAMTGIGYAATSLVIDVQSGFVDRLRLLGIRPASILLSRLLFDTGRVLPAGAILLVLGTFLGAKINEGVVGLAVLFALLTLWAAAYGGLYFVVGLFTRRPQAPLAFAPLFLPLSFVSSQYAPSSLLPHWARSVAHWNPFAYMADAARMLISGPIQGPSLVRAFAVALAMLGLTQLGSFWVLEHAITAE
jgi:ABC-2 type transport system permease protein